MKYYRNCTVVGTEPLHCWILLGLSRGTKVAHETKAKAKFLHIHVDFRMGNSKAKE